jgi:hypothetical protein
MHPSPKAETGRPLRPNSLICIANSFPSKTIYPSAQTLQRYPTNVPKVRELLKESRDVKKSAAASSLMAASLRRHFLTS